MGRRRNGPFLQNVDELLQLGFDPVTHLPLKLTSAQNLKEKFKIILRLADEQDAINRFSWVHTPDDITSQLIERILWYKGQVIFWYNKDYERFMVTPYTPVGQPDIYGRPTEVNPIPFINGAVSDIAKEQEKILTAYFGTFFLKPLYRPLTPEEVESFSYDELASFCVIIKDYSPQYGDYILPRQSVNEPILDIQSELLPFMRTGLLNSTGIKGMRVQNQDDYKRVYAANEAIQTAALTGNPNVPIVGTEEFQDLTGGNTISSEEFMRAFTSIDNLRLASYGIENSGTFVKQAHMLESEQKLNGAGGGSVKLRMIDSLSNRRNSAAIINSWTGLGIGVFESEAITGLDKNLNGEFDNEQSQVPTQKGENNNDEA